MGIFLSKFLEQRREEFKSLLNRFDYDYKLEDGTAGTLTAIVKRKAVSGNYIKCTLLLPNTLMASYEITRFKIYDSVNSDELDEHLVCEFDYSISVNATQTVMVVFKVSYQEV